jgi:hypothetical protein
MKVEARMPSTCFFQSGEFVLGIPAFLMFGAVYLSPYTIGSGFSFESSCDTVTLMMSLSFAEPLVIDHNP